MTARSSMRHRATIERDANATADVDDAGNASEPDWTPHLEGVPCRAWYSSGREETDGRQTVVVEDRQMIVPLGTDVTESDRVTLVTDRRGEGDLFDGPMRIESVGRRQDHLALHLEAV